MKVNTSDHRSRARSLPNLDRPPGGPGSIGLGIYGSYGVPLGTSCSRRIERLECIGLLIQAVFATLSEGLGAPALPLWNRKTPWMCMSV